MSATCRLAVDVARYGAPNGADEPDAPKLQVGPTLAVQVPARLPPNRLATTSGLAAPREEACSYGSR